MKEIKIRGEFIKLDALLKFSALCESGGTAKAEIQAGNVKVNGETCLMRGKKIKDGDFVEFAGEKIKVNASN